MGVGNTDEARGPTNLRACTSACRLPSVTSSARCLSAIGVTDDAVAPSGVSVVGGTVFAGGYPYGGIAAYGPCSNPVAFAGAAYQNPKFVEDIVRDIAAALRQDDNITWFSVGAENFESIHNHSAYAHITSHQMAEETLGNT